MEAQRQDAEKTGKIKQSPYLNSLVRLKRKKQDDAYKMMMRSPGRASLPRGMMRNISELTNNSGYEYSPPPIGKNFTVGGNVYLDKDSMRYRLNQSKVTSRMGDTEMEMPQLKLIKNMTPSPDKIPDLMRQLAL